MKKIGVFGGVFNPPHNSHINVAEEILKMNKDYEKVSPDYDEDNVITTIWVKKGAEVSKEVLTHITLSIINK